MDQSRKVIRKKIHLYFTFFRPTPSSMKKATMALCNPSFAEGKEGSSATVRGLARFMRNWTTATEYVRSGARPPSVASRGWTIRTMNHSITALRRARTLSVACRNTPESLRGSGPRISIRVQRPLDWKSRNCQRRNRMIANQSDGTVEINRNDDALLPGRCAKRAARFAIRTMIIVMTDNLSLNRAQPREKLFNCISYNGF